MINHKGFKQEGGEKSTNIQGENITIVSGISYSDAKEIALNVFKSNFLQLSEDAAIVARERAEELVEQFLQKLQSENPEQISQIKDPDMQYALFTAQKEYARSGEKEMEDVLVNILLERVNKKEQSLQKIVLNEALRIVPKLTNQQLDALTLIFIVQETNHHAVNDSESLKKYLKAYFSPFLGNLTKEKSCYKHLEFTGCCGQFSGFIVGHLTGYLIGRYRGIFSKGFKKEEFLSITKNEKELDALLLPCANNPSLFQFDALTEDILNRKIIDDFRQSEKEAKLLGELFTRSTMSVEEANEFIIALVPEMAELIDTWKDSLMRVMDPTSVGIALAYINLKRKAGIKLELDTWIK